VISNTVCRYFYDRAQHVLKAAPQIRPQSSVYALAQCRRLWSPRTRIWTAILGFVYYVFVHGAALGVVGDLDLQLPATRWDEQIGYPTFAGVSLDRLPENSF
jgi:hypothetical protein